jgi:PTH1 family peptidyl-tRNA hydrolase
MTRHNLGFRVIDMVALETGASPWSTVDRSLVCSTEIGGMEVILTKPLTFMNLSGNAIRSLVADYRLDVSDLLLVFDDLSLPFGKIRVRERGSAGGHRGMESVLRALESVDVARVRLGIGEDNMIEDKAEFVLSEFHPRQEHEVNEMIRRAQAAVQTVVGDGIARAMSVFNA